MGLRKYVYPGIYLILYLFCFFVHDQIWSLQTCCAFNTQSIYISNCYSHENLLLFNHLIPWVNVWVCWCWQVVSLHLVVTVYFMNKFEKRCLICDCFYVRGSVLSSLMIALNKTPECSEGIEDNILRCGCESHDLESSQTRDNCKGQWLAGACTNLCRNNIPRHSSLLLLKNVYLKVRNAIFVLKTVSFCQVTTFWEGCRISC